MTSAHASPYNNNKKSFSLGEISDAYTSGELVYEWQDNSSVNFVPGMALSQFDLMGYPYRNLTFVRREGQFSVLQVSFNLQRHTGYFLIQVSHKLSRPLPSSRLLHSVNESLSIYPSLTLLRKVTGRQGLLFY